jgi:hypothetical protein
MADILLFFMFVLSFLVLSPVLHYKAGGWLFAMGCNSYRGLGEALSDN